MRFSDLFYFICIVSSFSFISCENRKSTTLTVMSYNIRHGVGMDTLLDLSRVANIINLIDPDLCGLQEVDEDCVRSGSEKQTEYLSKQTGKVGTFGDFMSYDGGKYGMATLSAKPIVSTTNLRLRDGKYEPRTSIIHEVEVEEGMIIAFANVHFDWINDENGIENRLNQAKPLCKYLDSLRRPIIITGDFNCTPDSPTMKYFSDEGYTFINKGADNLSFQGEEMAEIDHLIYKELGSVRFIEKSIRLLEEPTVSDHRPLVVELEISY